MFIADKSALRHVDVTERSFEKTPLLFNGGVEIKERVKNTSTEKVRTIVYYVQTMSVASCCYMFFIASSMAFLLAAGARTCTGIDAFTLCAYRSYSQRLKRIARSSLGSCTSGSPGNSSNSPNVVCERLYKH